MDLREDLGLDDLGRFIVRTLSVDIRGNGVEIITASDGNSVEVLACNKLENQESKRVQDAWRDCEIYSAMFGTFTGTGRGLCKSLITADFMRLEHMVTEAQHKHKALAPSQQNHPKRKPQPNRGPVGKKDWK